MKRLLSLIVLSALGAILCPAARTEPFRFGLYPVKSDHADIAKVELAAAPLLTEHDIVSYEWKTHTLRLTDEGKNKLSNCGAVGVHGKPFVIVADFKSKR